MAGSLNKVMIKLERLTDLQMRKKMHFTAASLQTTWLIALINRIAADLRKSQHHKLTIKRLIDNV
jgi:hypothetical protein